MENLRIVFWDWNGTLFNDLPLMHVISQEIFRRHGLPEQSLATLRQYMGTNFTHFYYEHGVPRTTTRKDFNAIRSEIIAERWNDESLACLQDGAYEALQYCKEAGLFSAIVSAERSDWIYQHLREYDLYPYLDEVYCESKDKKAVLAQAAAEFGVSPQHAVYVDDTPDGLGSAASLGMHTCAFAEGYAAPERLRQVGPTCVVHSLAEFIHKLESGSFLS